MGSLDSRGIYIYDDQDQVSPLATLLNLGQASIGPALDKINGHALIRPVANISGRNAYEQEMRDAGRPPSPGNPLYVDRADTGQVERNRGTGWEIVVGDSRQVMLTDHGSVLAGSGSVSSTGGQVMIQGGTAANTSGPNGGVTLWFPKPFPNALLTFVASNGHFSGGGGSLQYEVDQWGREYVSYAVVASGGNKMGGRQHRINWIALGW